MNPKSTIKKVQMPKNKQNGKKMPFWIEKNKNWAKKQFASD